jgi:hypothetical protein
LVALLLRPAFFQPLQALLRLQKLTLKLLQLTAQVLLPGSAGRTFAGRTISTSRRR